MSIKRSDAATCVFFLPVRIYAEVENGAYRLQRLPYLQRVKPVLDSGDRCIKEISSHHKAAARCNRNDNRVILTALCFIDRNSVGQGEGTEQINRSSRGHMATILQADAILRRCAVIRAGDGECSDVSVADRFIGGILGNQYTISILEGGFVISQSRLADTRGIYTLLNGLIQLPSRGGGFMSEGNNNLS